jgi:hypothetical protein
MHVHHIQPKYLIGEDNSPYNLTPPISVAMHAALHKDLFEHFGNPEDEFAYKGLLGESLRGIRHTPEMRKKMSESHLGKSSGMKGKKHSKETKEQMSKTHTGMICSEESKQKVTNSKLGKKRKPFSDEWKKKMSDAHKARKRKPMSEETKKKISESTKGRIPWNKKK